MSIQPKWSCASSDGEFIYEQTVNAVSNALAHKRTDPDVNLNEKGEQDTRRFEGEKSPKTGAFLRQNEKMYWNSEVSFSGKIRSCFC